MFLHWRVGRVEGFSPHFPVKEHRIQYSMSFHLEQLIGLDRVTNILEDVILKVYVNQETKGGQEWSRFGTVTINLSEFAGSRETTRKFLLENSKTNTALSVTIYSNLKSGGAPFFKVPESAKKFISLEAEEDDAEQGFKSHVSHDMLMSDQRFMVREREHLRLPPHVVDTRENNSDIVDEVLARTLSGLI